MRTFDSLLRVAQRDGIGFFRWVAVAVAAPALILLMACGGEPEPGGPAPPTRQATEATSAPTSGQHQGLDDLQRQARDVLAARLSVPAENLALVSDEAVQWADTSLGCPEDGMAYAQMITPGHRMTFSHNGATYEVHTATVGSQLEPVSCEGGVSY